ncbi:MAG: hypothetical protein GOMPHAMPRED_008020 [Gomphillus americanus]|uniref:Uncharacterized protein n=1 Tax=Gomphillus americanus TaxID=1940652 RepID=A0A8H3IAQ3_9LECA|nr:MAG: hypothetical protein GOMPHAMPRED_008020 [Gomphillus americanus]
MEEVQRLDEAAPVKEGPLQNHISQISSGSKEEEVKVEIAEVAIGSPQIFAQIPPPNLSATEAEDLGIGANNNSTILSNEDVPSAPSTGRSHLLHGAGSLEDGEEDSFDMKQDSLPLLPSFDDVSTAGIGTSITGSDPQVQAFAKLEFDDGQFYMNTWAVELGRDMGAARKALQQEFEGLPDQNNAVASKHRSNSSADGGNNANRRREDSKKVAGSVISETGGILNYGPDAPPKPSKSSRRRAKSEGSASRLVSRSNSVIDLAMETESVNPSDIMYSRDPNITQPLNPQTHLPSPNECPLIPIHPPATETGPSIGHRGISRRHVKIQYSFEKRYFEMEVKGRNGAFVDEMYYGPGEVAELRSGCYIQIGGVNIKFILPNVADGETGADPTLASEAVSAMSFDFEDGRGEIMPASSPSSSTPPVSSDEESLSRRQLQSSDEDIDDEDDEGEMPRKASASKKHLQRRKKAAKQEPARPPKIKLKLKSGSKIKAEELPKSPQNSKSPSAEVDEEALKALGIDVPLAMIPPRRKGPGRPPKNGFMSKREEASLRKQAREVEKAKAVADGTLPPEALLSPDEASNRRKIIRKENGKEIHESIEGNDGLQLQTKLPKEKKPPKPPRSPSPFPDEASLTPEQLAKPQHSYVVMIHEALSSCEAGQMSLPQIYKAIEKRYPYFKYRVTTPGWQSSIRHNLSQHPAFKKTETREGKGWMWCLDPEISIEKEKRPRRPSPPPMTQQQYFPQGTNLYRSTFPYQGGQQPLANGTNLGQLAHPTASNSFMSPAPARASDGSLVPTASPADNLATYQSPYGLSNGKRGQTSNANSHGLAQSNSASTGANPYLLAQTMHRPAQSSPLRTPHTSDYISSQTLTGQGIANLSAQAVNAINKYKSTLMGSLTMANREILINTVIDKVLGRPVVEFASITDRTAASAIEKPLVGLLQQIREGELAAERQRLAQTADTTPQDDPIAGVNSISTSHQNTNSNSGILPQSTQSLAQDSTSKAAQDQASTPLPTTLTPTSIESKHTQATTAVPPSDKTPQAATPVASPITPQQGSLPEDTKDPDIDLKAEPTEDNKSTTSPASETAPSSSLVKQENGQKQFLSILSQLGPTAPSTTANIKGVNSARSLKRALDEEAQDKLINGGSSSSIEQPRAAKRVAV